MKNKQFLILLVTILTFFTSCKKDDIVKPEDEYNVISTTYYVRFSAISDTMQSVLDIHRYEYANREQKIQYAQEGQMRVAIYSKLKGKNGNTDTFYYSPIFNDSIELSLYNPSIYYTFSITCPNNKTSTFVKQWLYRYKVERIMRKGFKDGTYDDTILNTYYGPYVNSTSYYNTYYW